jgi:O-antigen/teichoic acid export membrane protein
MKNEGPPQNLTQQAVSGLLWAFSGTGSQAVLQAATMVVLARLLSPQDFGLVGAALVVVGVSTVFSQMGIGPALVQLCILETQHIRVGFTISLAFSLFLGAGVWLLAPSVAAFFHNEELEAILRVLAGVFPLQGLVVVAQALLQRELRFRALATLQTVSYGLGYGLVSIALAGLGWGAWALVAGHFGQALVNTSGTLFLRPHSMILSLEPGKVRELIRFGGGVTLARLANYVANQGDNLVVGRWLGTQALGIYGRAYQLLLAPVTLLGSAIDRVLFPLMARLQNQPERLALAYRRSVVVTAALTLPLSVTLLILAPELVQVLLGSQWVTVVVPFQIFASGMLFRTSYKLSDCLARATGAVYHQALRHAGYALFILLGTWVGHFGGLAGVAAGTLVAITVHFLLMAQLSLRITGLSSRDFVRAHLPAAGSAVLLGAGLWAIAYSTRAAGTPAAVTLVICGGLFLMAWLAVLRLWPGLFLDEDVVWVLRAFVSALPIGVQRLFRVARGAA